MRVISGVAKGRRLKTPPGARIRPTADRVKEALFSIIGEKVRGARVLDLFSGTGNLGIEALSRGASFALFVDPAKGAAGLIRENLIRTQLAPKGRVWRTDALSAISRCESGGRLFDLIFLDPPYGFRDLDKVLLALLRAGLMDKRSLVVVEHHRNDKLVRQIAELEREDERRFGDTVLTFFQKKGQA